MSFSNLTPGKALLVLYVDDERHNLDLFELQFQERFAVRLARSGDEALDILAREDVGVLLTDERMPRMTGIELLSRVVERFPAVARVIVSAYSDSDRVLRAINQGRANEYILKPWDQDDLAACIERCLALAQRLRDLCSRAAMGEMLARDRDEAYEQNRIVGATEGLQPTIAEARRAARSDATVLITGENGTGKELMARLIHSESLRAKGPFVALNSAALPDTLLESELFGHEPDAFTGARKLRRGRFELASGGTIFLDEIGDISPHVQKCLLRVLQEKEFQRVGGSSTVRVDTRVIAATNRNLASLVRQGPFREDLYYRLNVIRIEVPPLRERPQDVLALVRHFIAKYCPRDRPRPGITPEVAERLAHYCWPGNVRELENAVYRAVVMSQGGDLTVEDFGFTLSAGPETVGDTPTFIDKVRDDEDKAEAERYLQLLIKHGGNISRAAREEGVPRTTFMSRLIRLRKLGLL